MNNGETIDGKIRLDIRKADRNDSKELCSILNEIIEIGGTTGFENKLSESEFESYFLNGENYICCFLAENNGLVLGFQSLSLHPNLSDGWADIATFARVSPKFRGVGTTLFESTLNFARHQNIDAINATIRADNKSGLSYYSKMGFKDYSIAKKIPLQDGTPVDRISKKFTVTI
ncbi:MAG: GNAT family N-acetyltransferase [Gammaproteobacteria bacterium]|nr:GNAT family N-acetyltransferase [Gammaproteobacteria bacterium]